MINQFPKGLCMKKIALSILTVVMMNVLIYAQEGRNLIGIRVSFAYLVEEIDKESEAYKRGITPGDAIVKTTRQFTGLESISDIPLTGAVILKPDQSHFTANLKSGYGIKVRLALLVQNVRKNSPAARAGITKNNLILSLNGKPISPGIGSNHQDDPVIYAEIVSRGQQQEAAMKAARIDQVELNEGEFEIECDPHINCCYGLPRKYCLDGKCEHANEWTIMCGLTFSGNPTGECCTIWEI